MKIPSFVFISFLLLLSLTVSGQSVKIVPKKVTYSRQKPTSDFKKTFTVTYPIVKGKSPKLAKKIEDSISYQKVMFFDIADEIGDSQWLEEAEYQVSYNKKGVLNIYLSFLGTGAFESYVSKSVVVDLKNGNRVVAKDVFTNLNGLVAKIKKIQKADIAESIKEIKKEKDYGDIDTNALFQYVDFKKVHLEDFSIDDNGVTFLYSYGFPRIYMMIEPSGNYFLNWKEIKPFIRRDGLLGKFIR